MPSNLNSLLALGSLQGPNFKKKKKKPEPLFKESFDMMKPIKTDLSNNVGVNSFGQPLQQQPSLNIQTPSQMSTSLQLDAIGGQTQDFTQGFTQGKFGPEDTLGGATGGGFYGEIDPNEGAGTGTTTGTGDTTGTGVGGGTMFGADVYSPYKTSRESLFESFYGGLQDPWKSQITSATAEGSEGGIRLSMKELADLAGFDTSKLTAADYEALKVGGLGRFANYMEGTGEKLENLQGYRSMLLDQATAEGTYQVGGLLGMAEEESVSGLQSGRKAGRGREARKSLRDAMQMQLLGGEEAYQSELEGLRGEVVSGLKEGLAGIADKVIGLHTDMGTKLKDYSYQFGGDTGTGAGTGVGTGYQVANPSQYNQIYSLYDIESQDMQSIQSWINEQFTTAGAWPTLSQVESYIQNLGYGQDEEGGY